MTKEQREAYVRQLCKDKNYDEAKTAKVVAAAHAQAAADEDGLFDALIELPIRSSADYNKKVDELRQKASGLDTWFAGAQKAVSDAKSAKEQAEARIKKFEAKYGDLDDDDDPNPNPKPGKKPSAAEIDQLKADIAARDGHYLNLVADAGDVIARHARMFRGEVISTRDLLKKVGEAAADPINPRNITIDDAYNELYGDRVREAQQAEIRANEDRLRNEGAEAERKRFQRSGSRSGATITEDQIAFDAINSSDNPEDPNRKLSEQDRLSLFAQELRQESDKRAQAEA